MISTPLTVESTPHDLPSSIVADDRSIWRYRAAIPVPDEAIVSLGEGSTPLVPGPDGMTMKCEFVSPSGSFKDRGASVLVSGLRQRGIERFFLDSSGNAGASMAMYAAAAGIDCEVLVAETTPPAKTRQAEAYGASVTRLPGDREAVAAAARLRSEHEVYASHNWDPLFVHGCKTLAFELFEQSGGDLPDHVVIPVGYGSLLLGCHVGFGELIRNGAIAKSPRLHAAQPAQCAALHSAFKAGADDTEPIRGGSTAATAIATTRPLRGAAMLAALRQTGGVTAAVAEAEIAGAVSELGRAGFYIEPSSAVAFAAASGLRSSGVISPAETTVVVLTGSGLKT